MKKLFTLIILACATACGLHAQNKPAPKDTAKAKYEYFVVVPIGDYQQIANSLNEYKRLQMYDPAARPDQKVQLFQGIEAYLRELPKRIKVDSVKVK